MGIGPGLDRDRLLKTAVLTNEAARHRIFRAPHSGALASRRKVARIAVFLASDDAVLSHRNQRCTRRRPAGTELRDVIAAG